jgi:hypothetical protein
MDFLFDGSMGIQSLLVAVYIGKKGIFSAGFSFARG